MSRKFFGAAALLYGLAAASVPAARADASVTAAQPTRVAYATSLTEQFGSPIPWTGTLQLTVSPDGIINGYYRPSGDANLIEVTGGRTGANLWLDIGTSGDLHVTATMRGARMVGTAFSEDSSRLFDFSAVPEG